MTAAKTFRIHVPCNPPKTTAQQQKTAFRNGFVTKYDQKSLKDAKEYLTKLFMPYSPRRSKIFKGAIKVDILWAYPFRKSETKKRREMEIIPCDTRPDADNILKGFLDILTKLHFWEDDSQISELHFKKVWSSIPGITLDIKQDIK